MPRTSESPFKSYWTPPLESEYWYQTRQKAVSQALDAGDLKGARVLAEDMKDPYWRSVSFSKIASVTHEAKDFETAHAAAKEIGVSWWRSAALTGLVVVLAETKRVTVRNPIFGEIEDFFWRNAARQHMGQATKH